MAITAENTGTVRELTPAGNYIARCISMVEIGTVEETYLGVKKMLHKVRIGWEFPYELKVFNEEKGEQPIVVSKEYTLSLFEKANLRKELESWRGKAFSEVEAKKFDITKLIGVPCMINLIHKPSEKDPTKIYEKISAITPIAKGVTCPPQINPSFIFSFDEFSFENYNSLPQFLKDKIALSMQYKVVTGQLNPIADSAQESFNQQPVDDSDLPF